MTTPQTEPFGSTTAGNMNQSGSEQSGSSTLSDVKAAAGDTAQDVRSEVAQVAQVATERTSDIIAEARRDVRQEADRQVRRLGDSIGTLASDLAGMAAGEPRTDAQLTRMAQRGAHQLEQLADHIREGGGEVLVRDVRRFARRRPGLFLAGAAGAGFLIGRMVRNGAMRTNGHSGSNGDTPEAWRGVPTTAPGAAIPTPGMGTAGVAGATPTMPGQAGVTSPPMTPPAETYVGSTTGGAGNG